MRTWALDKSSKSASVAAVRPPAAHAVGPEATHDRTNINFRAIGIALLAVTLLLNDRMGTAVEGQQTKLPGTGFAAVPGLKGGQDVFGPL